jgi:hypothetical protein
MKLRHVVLFGFGKAHSSAAMAEVIRFAELKALVPGIDDFEWAKTQAQKALIMDTATFSCSLSPTLGHVTPTLCIRIMQPLRTGSTAICVCGGGTSPGARKIRNLYPS